MSPLASGEQERRPECMPYAAYMHISVSVVVWTALLLYMQIDRYWWIWYIACSICFTHWLEKSYTCRKKMQIFMHILCSNRVSQIENQIEHVKTYVRLPGKMPDRVPEYVSDRMQNRMSDQMSEIVPNQRRKECQVKCNIERQIKCQMKYQNICQIECQNVRIYVR
jgi:hypothetical protein